MQIAHTLPLSFLFIPFDYKLVIIGFVLFRLLDTLKPYPAGTLQRLKGSAGIMGDDIIAGLKEALTVGSTKGANTLSQVDGFFANAALKILMPPEAQKIESTLRKVGLGKQVDDEVFVQLPHNQRANYIVTHVSYKI